MGTTTLSIWVYSLEVVTLTTLNVWFSWVLLLTFVHGTTKMLLAGGVGVGGGLSVTRLLKGSLNGKYLKCYWRWILPSTKWLRCSWQNEFLCHFVPALKAVYLLVDLCITVLKDLRLPVSVVDMFWQILVLMNWWSSVLLQSVHGFLVMWLTTWLAGSWPMARLNGLLSGVRERLVEPLVQCGIRYEVADCSSY